MVLHTSSKKIKRPFLYIKEDHFKTVNGLHALELQKFLGLIFFPQHYVAWPDWCILKKPALVKSVVFLLCNDLPDVDSLNSDSIFPSLFNKSIDVVSPEAYNYSWDSEINIVPRGFLSTHSISMAECKNSILNPAAPRKWNPVDSEQSIASILSQFDQLDNEKTTSSLPPCERKRVCGRVPFELPPLSAPDSFDRTLLLLSIEQMKLERVPLPIDHTKPNKRSKLQAEFVPSKSVYTAVGSSSPMFAIDCEMVVTQLGSELARVTMVDEVGNIVIDRLVKPSNPVIDYVTRFSGITREMLMPIDTTIADIHQELDLLLPTDAILVGHSISNDLDAMKIFHPYLIDTSVIYNLKGSRAAKARLRFLAEHFLGRMIQTGKCGHSSAEDAIATMDLVRLKLSQGIHFGDVTTNWRFPEGYNTVEPESQETVADLDTEECDATCVCPLPNSHFTTVSHVFRSHILDLYTHYKNPGPPFHFFHRLLHDAAVPFAYWPVQKTGDDTSPTNIEQSAYKPNKHTLQWLGQLATQNRFVITRLKSSTKWDKAKYCAKMTKFVCDLYREVPEFSVIVLVCDEGRNKNSQGSRLQHPIKSLRKRPYSPADAQKEWESAKRRCYITVTTSIKYPQEELKEAADVEDGDTSRL